MIQAGNKLLSPWTRVRMAFCLTLLLVLVVIIVRRAYQLQGVEGTRLREMAEQQYLKKIELPPRRGTIHDRHGTPLATSVEVESIYANPRLVGDRAAAVARQLAEILDLDLWKLQQRLSGRRYFVWIKRRISPQQASLVRQLKIPGVYLTEESRRFYPNHGLGSAVVGFAGTDAKGLEGIELSYDGWLRGEPIRLAGLRDALGRQVFSQGAQPTTSQSHDLRLTLDKFIQFETEQALSEAAAEVRPKSGWVAAVVMDPRTGEILAMASAPSYDPNLYYRAKPAQWRNRTVADTFEPGSTIKVFTIAAALAQGVVKPGEVIDGEKGRWRIGRHTIHDSHRHEKLSLVEIIQKSSNIGVSKIAFRLGKPALSQALQRFGFGEKIEIHLPGSRAGVLRPHGRWSDVALANISFGQGLSTTVLHLAQGMSAIANHGVLVEPHLVRSIRTDRGELVKRIAAQSRRATPAWVADRVLQMMVAVTEAGGTGVEAALENYSVAGKTGTAQKVDPVTRTYSMDRWVSSFMGAVPASNPRLVIVVVVNEPDGEKHYGGEVAGPVFKRIAEKALTYLGVKPDKKARERRQPRGGRGIPLAAEGYIEVDSDNAPPLPWGNGVQGVVLVPDFTGLSMIEAIEAARKAQLQLNISGSGRVVSQSPGPGPVERGTLCRVSFRPPG